MRLGKGESSRRAVQEAGAVGPAPAAVAEDEAVGPSAAALSFSSSSRGPLGGLFVLSRRGGRRGAPGGAARPSAEARGAAPAPSGASARRSSASLPAASVSAASGSEGSGALTLTTPTSSTSASTSGFAPAPSKALAESSSPPSPPPAKTSGSSEKPLIDVVAGALARAASQATIHPIDTIKVRMQAPVGNAVASRPPPRGALGRAARELGSLYRGVAGAAAGTGLIIGVYFALYSSAKKAIKKHTRLHEGSVAFVAGAAAALGSAVVKVPLAVCVRSVQANVYSNAFVAAREIYKSAGTRGLMTGFVPTVLEDVPDTAIKFAAYESLRAVHLRATARDPSVVEDLVIGGVAGALAAAATTPLDVVKTVMMCSASARPSALSAAKSVWAQNKGLAPFFSGVGPRALSNGLNSAIFFCFFEAVRKALAAAAANNGAARAARQRQPPLPPVPPAQALQALEAAASEAATAASISIARTDRIHAGAETISPASPPMASIAMAAALLSARGAESAERLDSSATRGAMARWACAPLGAGRATGAPLLFV